MSNIKTSGSPEAMHPANQMRRELLSVFIFSAVLYLISGQYDILEKVIEFSQSHEEYEIDEILTVSFGTMIYLLFLFTKRSRQLAKSQIDLARKNEDLKTAMAEIKQLRGIIPICSTCKKIRDDEGFWHQVESYVCKHTDADFSHGICPDCMNRLYPEFSDDQNTSPSEGE